MRGEPFRPALGSVPRRTRRARVSTVYPLSRGDVHCPRRARGHGRAVRQFGGLARGVVSQQCVGVADGVEQQSIECERAGLRLDEGPRPFFGDSCDAVAVRSLGPARAGGGLVENITNEVLKALEAKLYYLAVVLTLTLPDICGALESVDGEASGSSYKVWCDTWMAARYPGLSGNDLYRLRCGVLHQARLGNSKMQYGRVLFTVPNAQRIILHNNVVNDALNLDATIFCRDTVQAVLAWYAAKRNDPMVQANLPSLLQFRPNGLAPYIVGVPLIA
jgi:hypothetical protein